MKKLTKPCLQCKKIITKQPSRSLKDWNNRTKFCSVDCRVEYMKSFMKGNKYSLGYKQSKDTLRKRRLGQQGEKGSNWQGDNVGYVGIHTWLSKTYGKPDRCENPDCVYPRQGAKKWLEKPYKIEWALIKGIKIERKRENFMRLCTSCHRKYDSK